MNLSSFKKINMTTGNIVTSIVLFSIPIVMGELFQNLYNSVDAIIVGNLVSKNALAAVTVSSLISNMLVNFFNGMSVGANVIVAKAFGRNDEEQLKHSICVAFTFAVVLGIILSLLGIILTPQLLQFAGAKDEYYSDALVYLRIYLAGLMFTVIYNNGAGILRAVGDSSTPFIILVITCIINVLLDLAFVCLFKMGIAGVGLATVCSQGISVVLIYRAICRGQKVNCLSLGELRRGRETILAVMNIGVAAGTQSALISLSNVFIVRYMNMFGTVTVAGIGIAQRLDRFIILPAKSFGITISTYVGQNIGSNQYDHIREGKNKCLMLSVGVTLFISLLVYIFAEMAARLFNPDPEIISICVRMMHVLVPLFWSVAMREVFVGILRGYGKSSIPLVLSLLGMVGFRQLFLAITMHYNPVIDNIFYCYPVAWISTLIMIYIYYLLVRRQLKGLGAREASG